MSDLSPIKKAADSASLEALTTHQSYYLVGSFVLFCDLVLAWTEGTNLLDVAHTWGDAVPVGLAGMMLLGFGFLHTVILPLARYPFVVARIWAPDIWRRDERDCAAWCSPSFVSLQELRSYALAENNSVAADLLRMKTESNRRHLQWKERSFAFAALALGELLLTPRGALAQLLTKLEPTISSPVWWVMLILSLWLFFLGAEPDREADGGILWPNNPVKARPSKQIGPSALEASVPMSGVSDLVQIGPTAA